MFQMGTFDWLYLLGAVLSFSYLSARLCRSVVRANMTNRMLFGLFLSLIWFIAFPVMLVTGRLFKSQEEIDEELYNKYLNIQIKEAIKLLRKSGRELSEDQIKEFEDRLRDELGDYQKMMADMIFFSKSITSEELAGLIAYRYYQKKRISDEHVFDGPKKFVEENVDNLLVLTSSIRKSKIDCDIEKSKCQDSKSIFRNLLGFHTLNTGLTFLGAISDSEHPFFFIIYYNGEHLKCFTPSHNYYNRATLKPFGVDKEADEKFFKAIYDRMNPETMYEDFSRRIDPYTTLKEIERQVNFVPRKGGLPEFGWDDISFEKSKMVEK